MTKRLDAVMAREYQSGGETKSSFTKVGVAFETRNGGWQLLLDAVPAPTDGQYKILLMEPRQKDQVRSGGGQRRPDFPDGDSSIPF